MSRQEEMDKYQEKDRFCGYCGKMVKGTQQYLLLHTISCEIDCCNKYYGDLSGGKA